jgi:hypothetical protein
MINIGTVCDRRIEPWDAPALARQARIDALVDEWMADPATVEQLVKDIVEHVVDHISALGATWTPAKADACMHSIRRAIEREARRQAEHLVDREGY